VWIERQSCGEFLEKSRVAVKVDRKADFGMGVHRKAKL
jgi:hypothetical protein